MNSTIVIKCEVQRGRVINTYYDTIDYLNNLFVWDIKGKQS